MNFNHHKFLQSANKALADLCIFGLCVFKRFVAIKGGLRRGRYKNIRWGGLSVWATELTIEIRNAYFHSGAR